MTDEALVGRAQAGDQAAWTVLCERHRRRTRNIAHRQVMFPRGMEWDDVYQEAMIGLLRAIRDFRPKPGGFFTPFLEMVVRRHLITKCIKHPAAEKNYVFESSARLLWQDGETVPSVDTLTALGTVEEQYEDREQLRRAINGKGLSAIEHRSLIGVGIGIPYDELGRRKTIDNAVQRARLKAA